MFALLDANAFYVNCQVAFDASLRGKPVVVLSSNDGNAIARSDAARALGIKMGQPWFEIRHLQREAGLIGLSAQFALYGDMSDRLMSLAADLGTASEIYSVDELFLDMSGVPGDLKERAFQKRAQILQALGLPCCVGVGHSKTLAKLANHVAKLAERKPGSYSAEHAGVCDMSQMSRAEIDRLLEATDVADVWGVGPRLKEQLSEVGMATALDLARMDPGLARRRWSIGLERTVLELRGISCMPLEESPPPRQQIACTRSFGRPAEALDPLEAAVSAFASRAAEKLRSQGSCAGQVLVFIRTSPFRSEPQFSRSINVALRSPSSDTSSIVSAALAGLRSIYRPGYRFAKAGVMLLDLQPSGVVQSQLQLCAEDAQEIKMSRLTRVSQAMDKINDRWGKGTLKVGSAVVGKARPSWETRQERLSPAYTTNWNDIPTARA